MTEKLLPPFPTDDATLAAVKHSLGAVLSFDEDDGGAPGAPAIVGADYQLATLLDFLSGSTDDDDPAVYRINKWNLEPIDADDAARDDVMGADQWWIDERPSYTEKDVIEALLDELDRVKSKARAEALREAADEWDAIKPGDLTHLEQRYSPGGPSLPSLFMRERAEREADQ